MLETKVRELKTMPLLIKLINKCKLLSIIASFGSSNGWSPEAIYITYKVSGQEEEIILFRPNNNVVNYC